jgi:hypothetical protein
MHNHNERILYITSESFVALSNKPVKGKEVNILSCRVCCLVLAEGKFRVCSSSLEPDIFITGNHQALAVQQDRA